MIASKQVQLCVSVKCVSEGVQDEKVGQKNSSNLKKQYNKSLQQNIFLHQPMRLIILFTYMHSYQARLALAIKIPMEFSYDIITLAQLLNIKRASLSSVFLHL